MNMLCYRDRNRKKLGLPTYSLLRKYSRNKDCRDYLDEAFFSGKWSLYELQTVRLRSMQSFWDAFVGTGDDSSVIKREVLK